MPLNAPKPSTTCAVSSKILMRSRPLRSPIAQSFGSCAGVVFTQPVPNSLSTCQSAKMGISRSTSGSFTVLPTRCLKRSSFGFTATPVSPSIVSGRVVATTRYSRPSSGSVSG